MRGRIPEKRKRTIQYFTKMDAGESTKLSPEIQHHSIHPNSLAKEHETYKGFYKLGEKNIRSLNINESTKESIHPSVLERYEKDETYRPQNLMDYLARIQNQKMTH